jgi:hypothetical protein
VKKKLILLDVALAAIVTVLAMQARSAWFGAEKRSEAMFRQALKPTPPPPLSSLPPVPNVTAAVYSAVAMKYPFSADRNPTVVVEPPKEKPMPELPVFYGIMTLPDGDTAIMSVKSGEPSKGIHYGEKVGEFTLVDVGDDEVILEWNGKTVTKAFAELRPRTDTGRGARMADATPRSQPQPQAQPVAHADASPDVEVGPGLRACRTGDDSPSGTHKDNWKKVVNATPFGDMCHWELEH